MWYMVVWSLLLMFMSQFFNVTNVVAFYVFASATMLLLPLVTAIYSTTSGNHGASLLRYCLPCDTLITMWLSGDNSGQVVDAQLSLSTRSII